MQLGASLLHIHSVTNSWYCVHLAKALLLGVRLRKSLILSLFFLLRFEP
jgi:hypothetical protein